MNWLSRFGISVTFSLVFDLTRVYSYHISSSLILCACSIMSQTIDESASRKNGHDEDDTDAILAELEAEANDATSASYQQRLHELLKDVPTSKLNDSSSNHVISTHQATYVKLKSDDEALRFTTEYERAVVHFEHPDFARCSIMNEHLDRIAQRQSSGEARGEEVVFARVDVSNAPFVVEKLNVKILPCVIGFVNGIMKGKLLGFEGICWDGKERDVKVSRALENLLHSWGVVKQKMVGDDYDVDSDTESVEDNKQRNQGQVRRGIKSANKMVGGDDDDDWD